MSNMWYCGCGGWLLRSRNDMNSCFSIYTKLRFVTKPYKRVYGCGKVFFFFFSATNVMIHSIQNSELIELTRHFHVLSAHNLQYIYNIIALAGGWMVIGKGCFCAHDIDNFQYTIYQHFIAYTFGSMFATNCKFYVLQFGVHRFAMVLMVKF